MKEWPDIIFIVIDALRKDHSKPLENILKKVGFISYENAVASAPWTTPSVASIFTGVYPIVHQAHETNCRKDFKVRLKRKDLLSIQLRSLGYKTFMLSANPHISPAFGFIGFDVFYSPPFPFESPISFLSTEEQNKIEKIRQDIKNQNHKISTFKSTKSLIKSLISNRHYGLVVRGLLDFAFRSAYPYYRRWPTLKGADQIKKRLKRILSTPKEAPRLIFIILIETHEPYFRNDLGNEHIVLNHISNILDYEVARKWKVGYSRQVKIVTNYVLEITKMLNLNRSLVIVTSDHGQLLGEHGKIGHGFFLYDELLRVPLLIKYPEDASIKIMSNNYSKYISLTRLKNFVIKLIKGDLYDDSTLYSDVVFAESYGIHLNYASIINNLSHKLLKNTENPEKYRIALYYKNFKGVFNVAGWRFEEITSFNPNLSVNEYIKELLKEKVMLFLKSAITVRSIENDPFPNNNNPHR